MKFNAILMLALTSLASAQQAKDYELRCRQKAATELKVNREDITTGVQDTNHDSTRVSWTYKTRNGYCLVDNRMNVAEFHEFSGNDRNFSERTAPISGVPRVKLNTAGKGNYNGGQSVKVTRGWVDTEKSPASVSLSGEHDFKITFFGDITRQNGDREYVITIHGSDRGDATGRATFRLNESKKEVEFISVDGRMNGNDFNGSFNR